MYVAIITESKKTVCKLTHNGTTERAIENLYGSTIDWTSHKTEKAAKNSLKKMIQKYSEAGII